MEVSRCQGCHETILDPYMMTASSGFHYHECCTKCSTCGEQLDETTSCFMREEKLYCKNDYLRMFKKCWICEEEIKSLDFVIRSSEYIFHLDCFTCHTCSEPIKTDKNYLYKDKKVFCEKHYREAQNKAPKSARGRTVFTDSQLHLLNSWYLNNPRPDAHAKERLVKLTGLDPKVIRVWFQNQRCKNNVTHPRTHH